MDLEREINSKEALIGKLREREVDFLNDIKSLTTKFNQEKDTSTNLTFENKELKDLLNHSTEKEANNRKTMEKYADQMVILSYRTQ